MKNNKFIHLLLAILTLATAPLTGDMVIHLTHQESSAEKLYVHKFERVSPRDSAPIPLATDVCFWYDQTNLYVHWEAKIDASFTTGTYDKRDQSEDCDFLALHLITGTENHYAYYFQALPFGNRYDGIRKADMSLDLAWNSLYSYTNTIADSLWICQMTIPFKDLRFSGKPPYNWKIIVTRYLSHQEEYYSYPAVTTNMGLEYFRNAADITIGERPKHSITPRVDAYALARISPRLGDEPKKGIPLRISGKEAGFDSAINLGTAAKLKLSMNPDFADEYIDIDPYRRNFRDKPIYPETRPFFSDDADVFEISPDLFDTRSIHQPLFALNLNGTTNHLSYGIITAKDRNHKYKDNPFDDDESHIIPDDFFNILSAKGRWGKDSVHLSFLTRKNDDYRSDALLIKPTIYVYKNNFLWQELFFNRHKEDDINTTGTLSRTGAEFNIHDLKLEAQYNFHIRDSGHYWGHYTFSGSNEFKSTATFTRKLSSKLLKSYQATLKYEKSTHKNNAPLKTRLGGSLQTGFPIKLTLSVSHYAGKELYDDKTHNWDESNACLLFYFFPWFRPQASYSLNHTLFYEVSKVHKEEIRNASVSGIISKHLTYLISYDKTRLTPSTPTWSNLNDKESDLHVSLKINFSNSLYFTPTYYYQEEESGGGALKSKTTGAFYDLVWEFRKDNFLHIGTRDTLGLHHFGPYIFMKVNLSF